MVLKMLGLVVDVVIAQAASYYFRRKLRMSGLNMVGSKKGQEKTWKGQDNEAFRRIKRLCILSLDFDLDSLGLVFIGRAKTMTNDHVISQRGYVR